LSAASFFDLSKKVSKKKHRIQKSE